METTAVILIPIIVALVAGLRFMDVPKRYLPLGALALGMVAVFIFSGGLDFIALIIKGLVFGFAATGIWSSSKALANK